MVARWECVDEGLSLMVGRTGYQKGLSPLGRLVLTVR